MSVKSSALNVERSAAAAAAAPVATVDEQNPWLGLVSFTEETRSYFHGREEEAAELSRRVQRKLLTILFGQSGLGKTSILQAGLVPRLRPEGFCPVYVRIDYDPHSPAPSEQIKRAVFAATAAAGTWTQTGSAVSGETLWEFLHHRDDVLKDASGRTLIPILIFDQFEEIFTLAQTDDAGRRRAQEFLADLADLVENRPPVALEQRIDRDEADAAKFDFARADYRILISLREDYLAHLEGLKGQMPSVTQNRMRLARMTGPQAVAAVRAPAPHLVSVSVAESVVRFVAGGTDLAHAEVEPSLLSLICRELNNTRLAQGQAEISADLLAGSRDTILSEFYERALADQPPGVRTFVEDVMLTDSGFRESVAEERVRKAFAAAGAAPDALAKLVDRRLLRVEDRLDLRRVEITHDVLCNVIGASRTVRREREALEESKRQLAEQKAREAATHRALVRARLIAAVALVLMVIAAGSAVFGWINLRRARAADLEAQNARQLTEQARGEAEKLVGFLLEDFYDELEPTGRLETVGKLAQKAVAYYDGLPKELLTPETQRYRGMALVRQGAAMVAGGNVAGSTPILNEARDVFEKLSAAGDHSEETTIGLALSFYVRSTTVGLGGNEQQARLEKAAGLLRPLATAPNASRRSRRVYADVLNFLSHSQPKPEGIATCEEARKILAGLGALDLTDLSAASAYGDVSDSEARHALELGRLDDAERLEQEVYKLAGQVLVKRPGDLRAMADRWYAPNVLSTVASQRLDFVSALESARMGLQAGDDYVRFNPADSLGWNLWSQSYEQVAACLFQLGRVQEAVDQARAGTELEHDPRNTTGATGNVYYNWAHLATWEAMRGNREAAEKALKECRRTGEAVTRQMQLGPDFVQLVAVGGTQLETHVRLLRRDYAGAYATAAKAVAESRNWPAGPAWQHMRQDILHGFRLLAAESALRLGHAADAETAARTLLASQVEESQHSERKEDIAQAQVLLAQALALQGRAPEARTILEPALAFYRAKQRPDGSGADFTGKFARALYVQALTEPQDAAGRTKAQAELAGATALLEDLSGEIKELRPTRDLVGWISTELTKLGH
jgi:tetratricopeptide (TPR) repeat protein